MGGEHLSLRSLTRARRAKKNEFHAFLLSRFLVKEALIVAHHHLDSSCFTVSSATPTRMMIDVPPSEIFIGCFASEVI